MDNQDLLQRIRILEEQVKDLQQRSIRINLEPREKENIKNAFFSQIKQSDQTVPTISASVPYLKVIWKNKILYIPFYKE